MAKKALPAGAARKLKAELSTTKVKAKVGPAGKKALPKKLAPKKLAAKKVMPKKPGVLARVLDRPDMLDATVLDRLAATVTARRTADPAVSHSARLMARGTAKVAQKFGEEAVECLIEAVAGNRDALVAESADVLYHLIVLWVDAGVSPEDVWAELHRREGISGIAEKARRKIAIPTTKIP